MKQTLVAAGALMVALSVGTTAMAGQRDRQGRDRNGRASSGESRPRDGGGPPPAAQGQDRGGDRRDDGQARGGRGDQPAPAPAPEGRAYERGRIDIAPPRVDPAPTPARPQYDNRVEGRAVPRPREEYRGYGTDRGRDRDDRYYRGGRDRDDRVYRDNGRYYGGYRSYGSPRIVRPHYYGPGGDFSVYFGWGNGYLYGSRWSGRVYGYMAPRAYGSRIYFGDVRLQVRPRNAAVYVDGYYAGVVDDFDGMFQRLTLEVGPHTLELDAPGLEPQFFDIYVDPARTTDIHADLYRY